tara:strand:+ start:291 stop:1040 length:750 start_codon:yes stop_codon:yes gene_type:complete
MERHTSYGLWIAIIYLEIVTSTILTQLSDDPWTRSAPLFALMFTLLTFMSFLIDQFANFRTIMLTGSYSVLISVLLVCENFSLINSTFVNYGVAVSAILASFFWCVSSHQLAKTDPAWHWYVFSCVFMLSLCAAFNNKTETARNIYIINIILLAILQICYFWNVIQTQVPGRRRCRHLIRVAFVSLIAFVLLIASVLQQSSIVSVLVWEQLILVLEVIIGFILLLDFCITDPINYSTIETTDATDATDP